MSYKKRLMTKIYFDKEFSSSCEYMKVKPKNHVSCFGCKSHYNENCCSSKDNEECVCSLYYCPYCENIGDYLIHCDNGTIWGDKVMEILNKNKKYVF